MKNVGIKICVLIQRVLTLFLIQCFDGKIVFTKIGLFFIKIMFNGLSIVKTQKVPLSTFCLFSENFLTLAIEASNPNRIE